MLTAALGACGDGDDDAGPAGRTTSTTPPSTQTSIPCGNVGFTPYSDDVAGSIVAVGLSCADAEALVRRVAGPLGPGGPATASADGFTCVLTGRSSEGLESATYECTDDDRRVTFRRT